VTVIAEPRELASIGQRQPLFCDIDAARRSQISAHQHALVGRGGSRCPNDLYPVTTCRGHSSWQSTTSLAMYSRLRGAVCGTALRFVRMTWSGCSSFSTGIIWYSLSPVMAAGFSGSCLDTVTGNVYQHPSVEEFDGRHRRGTMPRLLCRTPPVQDALAGPRPSAST